MRSRARFTYSNVIATLALFFALTGTAVGGAELFVTGANVRNHSLTGSDIRDGSLSLRSLSPAARKALKGNRGLRGAIGPQGPKGESGAAGPQGATGPQGPAGAQGASGTQGAPGPGTTTTTVTGADTLNYVDMTPLATASLASGGDYVVFASFTVANTGANNEYLNCGFRANSVLYGAAGVDTTAGASATGTSVTAITVSSAGSVEFVCTGSGGTTYDITGITMRVHFLG